MIAFYGAGMLGSGFVRALLKKGEQVQVWNRSADKAKALEEHGAVAFEDPAKAAEGASRVHLILSDDAAVDDVLDRARAGFGPGIIIIDHTTTSSEGAARRAEKWASLDFAFVHAPVFMGPQNALESTGIMLVSGERPRVDAVRPFLEKMTGKVVDLGDRPDAAAAFKLLGNCFLMFLTSGLADMFTLARAMNVDPRDAAKLFTHFNPGATIGARAERMLGADWSNPSWALSMARKDARLILEETTRGERDLAVVPAIVARMDELIRDGHGDSDWTVLGRDAVLK